jgi:hypothetical protein
VCFDRSRSLLARSVDEALLRVERQRERIVEMVQIGQPTKAAEELLSIFLRLFADLVELEHRINAMLQHTTAASALENIPQAINSAHIRLERQLLSCPLSQLNWNSDEVFRLGRSAPSLRLSSNGQILSAPTETIATVETPGSCALMCSMCYAGRWIVGISQTGREPKRVRCILPSGVPQRTALVKLCHFDIEIE